MSFKFGQTQLLVSMATYRVIMEKTVSPLFLGFFYPIIFIHAGNDDMHESSEEFEIRPDPTTEWGASCPRASKKSHRLIMGKLVTVATFSQLFLIKSFFKLAGKDDIHKSLNEFDIRPDPIRDHRVSCY